MVAIHHGDWETTPGHDCPGLIEARYFVDLFRETFHPLRGMIAPASLKRISRAGVHHYIQAPTPGHDCPGLIEALRLAHAGVIADDRHSGA